MKNISTTKNSGIMRLKHYAHQCGTNNENGSAFSLKSAQSDRHSAPQQQRRSGAEAAHPCTDSAPLLRRFCAASFWRPEGPRVPPDSPRHPPADTRNIQRRPTDPQTPPEGHLRTPGQEPKRSQGRAGCTCSTQVDCMPAQKLNHGPSGATKNNTQALRSHKKSIRQM